MMPRTRQSQKSWASGQKKDYIRRRGNGVGKIRNNKWCPGPESNRHGVATEGFSYQLQFSLPTYQVVCGLDFLFAML